MFIEVCGSAIETEVKLTVKLTVVKNTKSYVKTPHFFTKVPVDPEGYYCTTGVESGKGLPNLSSPVILNQVSLQISVRQLEMLSAT